MPAISLDLKPPLCAPCNRRMPAISPDLKWAKLMNPYATWVNQYTCCFVGAYGVELHLLQTLLHKIPQRKETNTLRTCFIVLQLFAI
jgi:hypothetical protein